MKTTLALIALGLFLIGCSKNESPVPPAKKTEAEEFFEEIKALAEQGDIEAQDILSEMYFNGEGVDQDKTQAAKWKEKANVFSRDEAAFDVLKTGLSGIIFEKSNKFFPISTDTLYPGYPGVSFVSRVPPDFPTDKSVADQNMRWISFYIDDESDKRRLVMSQSPLHIPQAEATEELEPKRWVLGPEIETCIFLFWSEAAGDWIDEWTETNSLPSRLKVELSFKKPDGSEPMLSDMLSCEVFSPDAARSHLEKAKKGDTQAQYFLGMMYSIGNQVKKDFKESAKWWRKSAEQGNAPSQAFLALSYFRGEGVPKDPITGYAWMHIAEINGVAGDILGDDILIYEKVKSLTRKMTDAQKNKAIRMAKEMINKNPKLIK